MRQRFGIAQALLGAPRLVIVDEPTAGLDPDERNRFLNLLAKIGEQVVVILSTHIVEDVTDLCPRMAMIAKGTVLLQGEPQAAIDTLKNRVWRRTVSQDALPEYQERFNVLSTRLVAGRPQINVFAESQPDDGFVSVEPDLEDVYFLQIRNAGRAAAAQPACRRQRAGRGIRSGHVERILQFELGTQLRQPLLWVCALLFGALAFGATTTDAIQVGGSIGNVNRNAPLVVAQLLGAFSLMSMFVVTIFIAGTVLRDSEVGISDMLFATPMKKRDYLVGRFAAGLVACLFIFAVIVGGMMLGP
jgi:hypothetical protein